MREEEDQDDEDDEEEDEEEDEEGHLLSFGVAVEVVGPHVLAEHDVVVEVDELLGEARDAVDVGLDGRGAEGGQVALVLENVLGTPRSQEDQSERLLH